MATSDELNAHVDAPVAEAYGARRAWWTSEGDVMAEAGLFIGWGEGVRGREAKGVQVFNEAVEYWAGKQSTGAIESFEVVLLGPHGGDLAGFLLVRGSNDQIAAMRADADFQRLNARAAAVVDRLGVIDAVVGDGIGQAIATFQEVISEFA